MKKRSLILTDRNYVQMYQTPEHQKLGVEIEMICSVEEHSSLGK